MTATRTTVEIERETAELALAQIEKDQASWSALSKVFVAMEPISTARARSIADLRRALAEGEKAT